MFSKWFSREQPTSEHYPISEDGEQYTRFIMKYYKDLNKIIWL